MDDRDTKERKRADETIVEPENALPEVTLPELPEALRQAAARAGWVELMPVQARAIPYLLAGRDLMVQSRTGSGKTGAFVLPIFERIDVTRKECQALVLVPTRELCSQVAREAEMLGGPSGPRTVAVYGGTRYGPQIDGFRKGAHLVVGTPGRVLDHLLRGTLTLDGLRILVFDESDRMLSMGFYPDMRRVRSYLPSRRINAYMFSATYPPHVMRLAGEFLRAPEFLGLSLDHVHVAETEHVYYITPQMEKDRSLVRIIEMENPAAAIVFCNRKSRVEYVTTVLQRFGYDADQLTSDLTQGARDRVMDRLRRKKLRFLVATDVAARGIDIPELSHIFLYETPEDPEDYIHRAGRTGRAGGARGVAVSLVGAVEEMDLLSIGKRYGIDLLQRPLPSDEDVEKIVSERVTVMLEARLRARDKLQTERMQRFIPLVRSLGENEDELAVITMLLDDYYQQTLHAPPETPSADATTVKPAAPLRGKRRPKKRSRRRR